MHHKIGIMWTGRYNFQLSRGQGCYNDIIVYTMLVLRMAHRKWKETKQQPSMLPGPAVPGGCLVSLHILWAILSTSTVDTRKGRKIWGGRLSKRFCNMFSESSTGSRSEPAQASMGNF